MPRIITLALAVVLFATVGPATAEHNALVEPPRDGMVGPGESSNLDVQIKIGLDQFRVGGRLFGPNGVAGAWLNGERTAKGFALDGRLQSESGRALNFKVDAEALDRMTRAALGWFSGRLLGVD
jgi:hypothetical protein